MIMERLFQPDPEMGELEAALLSSLNPVEPDPKFVTRVRQRIERRPTIVLEARTFWEAYVIMATGLFVGAGLLWLLRRRRRTYPPALEFGLFEKGRKKPPPPPTPRPRWGGGGY